MSQLRPMVVMGMLGRKEWIKKKAYDNLITLGWTGLGWTLKHLKQYVSLQIYPTPVNQKSNVVPEGKKELKWISEVSHGHRKKSG